MPELLHEAAMNCPRVINVLLEIERRRLERHPAFDHTASPQKQTAIDAVVAQIREKYPEALDPGKTPERVFVNEPRPHMDQEGILDQEIGTQPPFAG